MYTYIYIPIGSMYAIYGNIYHQYTPNVSIYTIHGSYGIYIYINMCENCGKHETYLSHLGRTSVSAGRIIVILSRISSCQAYCYILVRICLFLESIYSRMYIYVREGGQRRKLTYSIAYSNLISSSNLG